MPRRAKIQKNCVQNTLNFGYWEKSILRFISILLVRMQNVISLNGISKIVGHPLKYNFGFPILC